MFDSTGEPPAANWAVRLLLVAGGIALISVPVWVLRMTRMPLQSFRGELDPLSVEEIQTKNEISRHVRYLAETVGVRNLSRPGTLESAADYIRSSLEDEGYRVADQAYPIDGRSVRNLEAVLSGSEGTAGNLVVGAHYDCVDDSPGADDNATGVAAVLELARLLRQSKPQKTIRFVLFVNEEPPYFQTEDMGSLVYARGLRRDKIAVSGMISLETIGFYSNEPGSQRYPEPLGLLYPKRGDFVGFVGNSSSRDLLHAALRAFRATTRFPSEGIAAPEEWPGIGWSDHWSFWRQGYPAIMVTDTAPFRYPYYHTPKDTAERIDFSRMSRVVQGLRRVVETLSAEK